jgi:hypothetical protein
MPTVGFEPTLLCSTAPRFLRSGLLSITLKKNNSLKSGAFDHLATLAKKGYTKANAVSSQTEEQTG